MAVRTLLKYPDPGLKRVCTAVERFDDALRALAVDLGETMRAAPGVGITAAHIGVFERVFVLDLKAGAPPMVFVNPQILEMSGAVAAHREGSISMPGIFADVARPRAVTIRYRTLDGELREERAEGFAAVCMQHEVDQLDGIFWLSRLSRLKRDGLLRKWEKQAR